MENDARILIFEDDESFSALIEILLSKLGCTVIKYDSWPAAGWEKVTNNGSLIFDLVILDLHLPGIDGLGICRLIKNEDKYIPVVFMSGVLDSQTIISCYQEGAIDCISKSLENDELSLKLSSLCRHAINQRALKDKAEQSRNVAMTAMTSASELGRIIQFLESSFQCHSYEAVVRELFDSFLSMGLNTTAKIFHKTGEECFYHDENLRIIESQLIDQLRTEGRIFDFSSRSIFNYPHISVLIKNMPDKQASCYGQIKDNVCILLNGAESRIAAIEIELESGKRFSKISTTIRVIKMMIQEIESSNQHFSSQFQEAVERLEVEMLNHMMHFNLLEQEEQVLMETLTRSITQTGKIFDQCIEQEKRFKVLMNELARTLEN